MTRAADHLVADITRIINRMRLEYELTYAEAVGVLEMVKADLIEEARQNDA